MREIFCVCGAASPGPAALLLVVGGSERPAVRRSPTPATRFATQPHCVDSPGKYTDPTITQRRGMMVSTRAALTVGLTERAATHE